MWKKLFFSISQLVISSAGQPLTPRREPDTHKGSVPTDVKEVEEQFNAKQVGRRVWQGKPRPSLGSRVTVPCDSLGESQTRTEKSSYSQDDN